MQINKREKKEIQITRPCSVLNCSVVSATQLPARLLCPWGFSRQEYWRGLPCPPPGDLPNPGTEPRSPALQAGSLPSEPPGTALYAWCIKQNARLDELQAGIKVVWRNIKSLRYAGDTPLMAEREGELKTP